MDLFKTIKNFTDKARKNAKFLELQINNNNEDLIKANPHTSIYKILDAIDDMTLINS